MPNLKGSVAVVTGASRGAGRGIALALGECGATVYVTGRSVKGQPTTDNMPGTIDETAESVTSRGGVGVAARCDHTKERNQSNGFRNGARTQKAQHRRRIPCAWIHPHRTGGRGV